MKKIKQILLITFMALVISVAGYSVVNSAVSSPKIASGSVKKPLNVYVSIKPLYSLVAMVSNGVFTPRLIVNEATSPHNIELTHHQQLLLDKADLIFIISKTLEKPIYNVANHTMFKLTRGDIIDVSNFKGLNLLKFSNNNLVLTPNNKSLKDQLNYYIWLDPINAEIMLQNIANILAEKDPIHAKEYNHNAVEFSKHIQSINNLLTKDLAPYKDNHNFLLYHSGYNYFENRFNLHGKGYIQTGYKDAITTAHVKNKNGFEVTYTDEEFNKITNFIAKNNITCVFLEPQFREKRLRSYLESNNINHVEVDTIGYNEPANWQLYYKMMANNLGAFKRCLNNK